MVDIYNMVVNSELRDLISPLSIDHQDNTIMLHIPLVEVKDFLLKSVTDRYWDVVREYDIDDLAIFLVFVVDSTDTSRYIDINELIITKNDNEIVVCSNDVNLIKKYGLAYKMVIVKESNLSREKKAKENGWGFETLFNKARSYNNHILRDYENQIEVNRGDVFYIYPSFDAMDIACGAELETKTGRPGLIISSNEENHKKRYYVVVYLTSKKKKEDNSHIQCEIVKGTKSTILCKHIYTVDASRLGEKICTLDDITMGKVGDALAKEFNINDITTTETDRKLKESIRLLQEKVNFYEKQYNNLLDKLLKA